jgi:hypothetical protein
MTALAGRKPESLDLAADVQFTENNVVIPVGKGLWNSISRVAATGMELRADRQAAWFGVVWGTSGDLRDAQPRGRRPDRDRDGDNHGFPAPFGD